MILLTPVLILSLSTDAFKILVYNPKTAYSHSSFTGRIADLLVDAGHDVTSLIPVLKKRVPDGTTKSKLIYIHPQNAQVEEITEQKFNYFDNDVFHYNGAAKRGNVLKEIYSTMCRDILSRTELLKNLKDQKFDVYIGESFDACAIGLAGVFNPKSVILTSTTFFYGYHNDDFGIPPSLSFNPSLATSSINVHSIVDRAYNIYAHFVAKSFFHPTRFGVEQVFKDIHGPSFPSLQEISSRVAYAFENTEPLIEFAHPTLHRVISVGGITVDNPSPLSQKWEEILSRRERSVLISFGSLGRSDEIRIEIRRSILKMVSNFSDVMFIWKYDGTDDFSVNEVPKVKNVVLDRWTPQNDLLNDKRLAVFFTHAGIASTLETATRGVPALLAPIFFDQPRNAGMLQHHGMGKIISKYDLDKPEILIAGMRELLGNPRYRENAKNISEKIARKPFGAKEILVKHVEFAAEFGPSSALRPSSLDMNVIEYHNLDILSLASLFLMVITYCIFAMVKTILRLCVKLKLEKQ